MLAGAGYGMGISQVGLFTIPAAALLTVGLVRSGATGREMLGVVEGVGGVGVAVGVIHLDFNPCPSNGTQGTFVLAPGQTSASCGGFDGLPWLIAGLVVMAGALVAFWLLTRPSNGQLESGPP